MRGPTARAGPPLTLDRARSAAERLQGVAYKTGVMTCATLDRLTGAAVIIKPEQFQRGGSFKFRGAYNRLAQLNPAEREAGVVAYSSGNHGAAVALAASLLGTRATVVVPENADEAKVSAMGKFGADVRAYRPGGESRESIAQSIVDATGAVLVPPFEDYEVMAGQGTIGLELAAEAGELDVIVVPVGGGGLVAGVGTVIAALMPQCRIVGVEPATADDTRRSLASGRLESNDRTPETIADGLRALAPGARTFAINRHLLDEVVVVTDEDIVGAMRFCFEEMKTVVEPSGAVTIAALLKGAVAVAGRRVAAVISGGNLSVARFAEIVTPSPGRSPSTGPLVRPPSP
jgi:threo-3-hydroxy-L-aspartate ammonia-lyase